MVAGKRESYSGHISLVGWRALECRVYARRVSGVGARVVADARRKASFDRMDRPPRIVARKEQNVSHRPNFLTSPGVWIRAARVDQSPADYASPIEVYTTRVRMWEAVAGVLLAVAIGVGLAAALVAWWTS